MKYFGTDGVRFIYSNELVTLAYKIGYALAKSYDRIIVAVDTRDSSEQLALSFTSGAVKGGATVSYGGIMPTPTLAFAVRDGFYKIGAMITASHNPPEYNGIKLFDGEGYKLTEKELIKIENEIDKIDFGEFTFLPPKISLPIEMYIEKVTKIAKPQKPVKVLVDTASGATTVTAPKAFGELGIDADFIGLEGTINTGVGVFFVDKALEIKKEKNLDLAFIFDGDGDRIIAIDEENQILDGDIIIYILAKWLLSENKLVNNTVVGTVYSSLGLEKSLANLGINLIRTNVGDKYISEKLRRDQLSLGGESSGHIIYNSTTGDGLKTALLLTWLASVIPLSERRKGYYRTPKAEMNFPYSEELWNELSKKINEIKSISDSSGRILLRKSGTEPLIRLMFENTEESTFQKWKKLFENQR